MYFKRTICLLLLITITGSSSFDWETFKRDHNKEYASVEEETERKEIFFENVNRMKEYERTHPDATFTMRINHLTDRRSEELVSDPRSFLNLPLEETEESIRPRAIIPTALNWRFRNVITPVYNQSILGPSPAIVAVEMIESYGAIQAKNITLGSIDQVIACCGNVNDILSCILNKTGGGICSREAFNSTDGTCNPTGCEPFITFNEVKRISPPKETTILEWIQDSPLYVVIDAHQLSFQAYQTGIYSDLNCAKTNVNHAVQLVGYGFRSGIPYWLLKNSWGEGWGEQGYMRMERGKNMCGITQYVVQIGTKAPVSNAVRLVKFDVVYLAVFCLFVQIFSNLK